MESEFLASEEIKMVSLLVSDEGVFPSASWSLSFVFIHELPVVASIPKLPISFIHWNRVVALRSIRDLISP